MAESVAGRETSYWAEGRQDTSPAASGLLNLRLLGRMQALDGIGRDVLPRVRKTRALLAIIALASGKPVMRLHVTALLWSTRDAEQARGSLRQSVHELNELLQPLAPDLLVAERSHLQLRDDRLTSDVRMVTRATVLRPESLDLLRNGPLLEDLVGLDPAFDRWLLGERKKLSDWAAGIAASVLAAQIAAGAPAAALLCSARALLDIDPLRESGWRAMMMAHMATGDRASAIATFERCAGTLAELARVSPGAETQSLFETIRNGASGYAPLPAHRTPVEPIAASPRGVRVGVMPFRVLGAADDDGLSFGLADEITNALARFRGIILIGTPSLAAIRSDAAEGRLRSVGLDFLLEGTLQRDGNRIRVTVRLLQMAAGHGGGGGGAGADAGGTDDTAEVVWARRFDFADRDLFSLQDEVAAATVAQIDPELLLRAATHARARQPSDPSAYQLMLRAIPALYRLEEQGFRAAGPLLESAIARDSSFAPAYAWLAYWHVFLVGQGWATDIRAAMIAAGQLADRAVALDPADARGLTIAGHVRSYLDRQLSAAIELHERALALNPNLPLAWTFSGLARAYDGQHEEAIRRIDEARRLSPFDPHGFFFETALMVPKLMLGQFEQVVELARRAVHINPALSSTYKGYLSALGYMGPSAELLSVRARLLQLEPGFCLREADERSPLRRDADRAIYTEGLRRAGLPETSTPSPSGNTASSGYGSVWAIG